LFGRQEQVEQHRRRVEGSQLFGAGGSKTAKLQNSGLKNVFFQFKASKEY
jgi:hypothetical protein